MSRPDTRPLRTDAYEYELPAGRIARYPTDRRDESRLLVLDADPGDPGSVGESGPTFHHRRFHELPGLLGERDLLVLNDSRVFPARLRGRKATGAPAEVFLLRPLAGGDDPYRWEALVRPGSKLKPGRAVEVAPDLRVIVEEGLPGGGRIVRLDTALPVAAALERHGRVPLPPYLEREAEPLDRERYQTVYARVPGSVAAPTAGLHFTPELLGEVEGAGTEIARVTLHVGPGTFRPVEAPVPEEHAMHREAWEVPPETARAVARARARGGRVWAVGTTVVRTLESAADPAGVLRPGRGETDLFIVPGYRFRVVDALVTNFHLPRSTLLMLVAAFAGYRRTMAAYREAIRGGYRFYSYGDAMAVLPARAGTR